ncbi:MAG: lipopolysaccharide core heptose(I) kinase RfaP [Halioglobus sp.]
MSEYYLRQDMAAGELAGARDAGGLLAWAGAVAARAAPEDIFRDREGRRTLRVRQGERSFFLKLHRGVGWSEILKNLLQARLPVLGAGNEYRAVLAVRKAGIDTLEIAAYAEQGCNPARLRSMLLTDELVGTRSLEHFCAGWSAAPPPFPVRVRLLVTLAETANRMHAAGINHRDFYLCHFHLDPATLGERRPRCHLIDLHRAQLRSRTPRRWRVKDLAALYFSALDCGLGQRDLLRFIRHYGGGLREALADEALWRQVQRRASRLYRREHGREAPRAGEPRAGEPRAGEPRAGEPPAGGT